MQETPQPHVDPDKLTAFETPVARKSAIDKAREAAQRKAAQEEAATRSVLQSFEEEYGPVDGPSRPAKRNPAMAAFDDGVAEEDEGRARRRQRQKSGASYLNELKTMNEKRHISAPKTEVRSKAALPTVYLYGLPLGIRQSSLLALLKPYGAIQDLRLNGSQATATFASQGAASAAKKGLPGEYLGGGCWLQTTAQAKPELPFDARPKQVNLSRMAPPSALAAVPRPGPALELRVMRPTTLAVLTRIHGVAQGVLEHGPAFEAILRKMRHDNPAYAFLFSTTSSEAIYYRYCLLLAYQGLIKLDRSNYLLDDNTQWFPPLIEEDDGDEDCNMEFLSKVPARESCCILSHSARMRLYHLLRGINGERRAISAVTAFAISHPNHVQEVVDIMVSSFQPNLNWKLLMARLWAVSDILHNTTLPVVNIWRYRGAFEAVLTDIVGVLAQAANQMDSRPRRDNFCSLVLQMLDLWHQWGCFSNGFAHEQSDLFVSLLPDDAFRQDHVSESADKLGQKETRTARNLHNEAQKGLDVENSTIDVDGEAIDLDGEAIDLDGEAVDLDGEVVDLDGTTIDLDGEAVNLSNEFMHSLAANDAETALSGAEEARADIVEADSPDIDLEAYEKQYGGVEAGKDHTSKKTAPEPFRSELPKVPQDCKADTEHAKPQTMPKIKLAFGTVKKAFKPNLSASTTQTSPQKAELPTPASIVAHGKAQPPERQRSVDARSQHQKRDKSPSPERRHRRASPTYDI